MNQTSPSAQLLTADIDVAQLLRNVATAANLDIAKFEMVEVVIQAGARYCSFMVDPALAIGQTFYFLNCFNVLESITLPAVTTAKVEVEQSEASVRGVTQLYDRTSVKTYEVEASPLTFAEAEWAEHLLTSPVVYRHVDGILAKILITEITSEVSDGSTDLCSVKFTWRYAEDRKLLPWSADRGSFSQEYTNQFD